MYVCWMEVKVDDVSQLKDKFCKKAFVYCYLTYLYNTFIISYTTFCRKLDIDIIIFHSPHQHQRNDRGRGRKCWKNPLVEDSYNGSSHYQQRQES